MSMIIFTACAKVKKWVNDVGDSFNIPVGFSFIYHLFFIDIITWLSMSLNSSCIILWSIFNVEFINWNEYWVKFVMWNFVVILMIINMLKINVPVSKTIYANVTVTRRMNMIFKSWWKCCFVLYQTLKIKDRYWTSIKKLNRELKNLSQTSFLDSKNIWTLLKT